MQNYLFIGSEPRYYSQYMGESFWANNGDVKAFEFPPGDNLWIPTDANPTPAPVVSDDDWFNTPPQESAN